MDREGTLQIVEGRCVLRFERRFGHPPEKVWRALTEYDRPRLLEYRMPTADLPLAGAGDRRTLGFELHADPAGCRLVFTNTFEDRPGAASFAAGWEGCLDALEQELAGRGPVVRTGRGWTRTRRTSTPWGCSRARCRTPRTGGRCGSSADPAAA